MRRRLLTLAATAALMLTIALPGSAVTNGELDEDGHPFVGLMVAKNAAGTPMWRCSGTLLDSTHFLTAGHCTDGAVSVELWFATDVEAGRPGNGYPFTGERSGTPSTHPDYNPNAFFLADLGMVVLDEPMVMSEYGALPTLNVIDGKKVGKKTQFTSVGYGLQRINPVFVEAELVRMFANPHLIMKNVPGFTGDFSIMLSNNASTGGTCFGDSGGPNFFRGGNVIAGVTSFGLNGNCAGTGGVYRIDRAAALDWLEKVFGLTP